MARTFLVTGASTGIGEATARHLDRLGHRVFAGVRTEDAATALRRGASSTLEPVRLDVTDEDQVREVADLVDERVGAAGLDGVVNNAGIARGGPLEFLSLDEWRTQFEVNVIGQVAVTKAVLPMIRRARGRIVFVGSVAGRVAPALMAPYAASKHAIEAVGESLRHELRPWGIRTIVVEPGVVQTPIWQKGRATAARLEDELGDEADRLYRDAMDELEAGLVENEEGGVPAQEVAEVIERALLARRPRARYLVGADATAAGILDRVAPDSLKDVALRRLG